MPSQFIAAYALAGFLAGATVTQDSNTQDSKVVIVENAGVYYEKKVDISAPASGLISEVAVEEGQAISKDEVIVQLDQRITKAELEVAKQEAEAAEKQAKDESNILYANKVSEVASAEYENFVDLLRKNATSPSELRRKKLEAEKSKLSIRVAELEREKNVATSLVTKEKVKAAEVQLALRQIKAPFNGLVARSYLEQDAWAKEGERILTVVAVEELKVGGNARGLEKLSPHVLFGSPVTIEVQVAKEMPPVVIEGTIGFVSPIVEADGSVRVWSKISNQQLNGQWLFREGMTASMKIQVVAPKGNEPVSQ
jgi:multidrug resistance efflux pump